MSDDVVERRDHVADAAAAGLVEHLQHDQARAGAMPVRAAAGIEAVAGDDAGDVRAVAVVVVRRRARR